MFVKNFEGMVYCCLYDCYWMMIFVSQGCFEFSGYFLVEIVENNMVLWEEIIYFEDC